MSDPDIRNGIIELLKNRGGSAYGDTFGDAVSIICPFGASMNGAKRAVNSLAHSTVRPHQVRICREGSSRDLTDNSSGYTIQLR